MESPSTLSHTKTQLITREQLITLPAPPATRTHVPVPHHQVVQALTETLGFRHLSVVREQYAIDHTGMKMFGVGLIMAPMRFSSIKNWSARYERCSRSSLIERCALRRRILLLSFLASCFGPQ